jgi:outer membrane protein assembly factor BamD
MRVLVVGAVVLGIWAPSATAASRKSKNQDDLPATITAQERFDRCQRQMRGGNLTKAIETCNRVRNYHRDDLVSILAELAVADIYYKRKDFTQARLAYEDFVRLHPRNARVDYAVWRIGHCWFKESPRSFGRDQTASRQALTVWTGYETRFPNSAHVKDVQQTLPKALRRLAGKEMSIARYYRVRRSWRAARGRAEIVVERYPESEFAPRAAAWVVESWQRWGFVEEARASRDRLASLFPDTATLARLDRILARPPGEAPEEPIFAKPFRIPKASEGMIGPMGGPAMGMPGAMGGMGGMGGMGMMGM